MILAAAVPSVPVLILFVYMQRLNLEKSLVGGGAVDRIVQVGVYPYIVCS